MILLVTRTMSIDTNQEKWIARISTWISRSKYKILLAGLFIFGFICSNLINIVSSPIFNVILGPTKEYGDYGDYDQWLTFAAVIKQAILNNGAGLNLYASTYKHAFTPLYSTSVALIDFIFNNGFYSTDFIIDNWFISTIVFNGLLYIGTLFVLKKIVIDLYHFSEKDAMIVLIVYQSNITINIEYLTHITSALLIFCVTLAFYTNVKFVDQVDLSNGLKVFFTNTLVMYSRESIWPFLLVGPALVLIKGLQKHDNMKFGSLAFVKKELMVIYFAIILPVICYLLYFLMVDAFSSILMQFSSLSGDNAFRTVLDFFVNTFIAFSFMPILILLDIKGVLKKNENLPLILWIGMFFVVRLIMPGAFLYQYWDPIIFCFCILCLQPLKTERFERKANRIVSILVITNLVLLVIAILFPKPLIILTFLGTNIGFQ